MFCAIALYVIAYINRPLSIFTPCQTKICLNVRQTTVLVHFAELPVAL